MMTVNTILFDLDGTLVNTNELIIASFEYTLAEYFPGKYSREDIVSWIGEPLRDTFVRLDAERADEWVDVYRRHNRAIHETHLKEYEGAYETVKALAENGYKLGVVTTKFSEGATLGLKIARLQDFFPVVIGLDHVSEPKPHPEPVKRALSLLESDPDEAIMIGDSVSDIRAGQQAGTQTAGVAWSIKGRDVLAEQSPDYMLEQMLDLLAICGVNTDETNPTI